MRLIDADALENQFGISDADLLALDEIRHAPIVDAEVVVRCKDCYQSAVINDVFYCTYWMKNTDENGYCHEGG